jgi:putative ABC transport system ATP-binding protein
MEIIASFEKVRVERQGRVILNDLSFALETGCFCLVGPSGSGKTTIFNVLAGFLKPQAGRVTVTGRDISLLGDRQLARLRNTTVSTIFQAYNLVGNYSLADNVVLPALVAGQRPDKPRGMHCLAQVGLADRAADVPTCLSGGERQRLAIARALYMRPRLLLADEPTGNLDQATAREVLAALMQLNSAGSTLFIATHDPLVIEQIPVKLRLPVANETQNARAPAPNGAKGEQSAANLASGANS